MADFKHTYDKYIQPNEAYFVDDATDRGGMTYGGIASKIFPDWEGFEYIREYIKEHGKPKWNQRFPELDPKVESFFEFHWNKNNFNKIKDQSIADILFDFFVNTISDYAKTGKSYPVKRIQKKLGLFQDGLIGPQSLVKLQGESVFDLIKQDRKDFYNDFIKRNPDQERFRKTWFSRIDKFSYK